MVLWRIEISSLRPNPNAGRDTYLVPGREIRPGVREFQTVRTRRRGEQRGYRLRIRLPRRPRKRGKSMSTPIYEVPKPDVFAVVTDASGQKLLGMVSPNALKMWALGECTTVVVTEPLRISETMVEEPTGSRIQVSIFPLDPMDPGVTHVVVQPIRYYRPNGHKLQALYEDRWTQLRAMMAGIVTASHIPTQ